MRWSGAHALLPTLLLSIESRGRIDTENVPPRQPTGLQTGVLPQYMYYYR